MRTAIRFAALALIGLALPFESASAHEVRPAYLEIRENLPGRYHALWKVPRRGDYALALHAVWPPGTMDLAPAREDAVGDAMIERRVLDFGPEGLTGKTLAIDGLSSTSTDALVRIEFLDGRVQTRLVEPKDPRFVVPARTSRLTVAHDFVALGIGHILGGYDHLLFVFGLLLLVSGIRPLVKSITAFTLAHSITLGLATLGVVRVPQPPAEAAIALSIVFLARELLEKERGRLGLAARRPWVMSFGFGLLHGFGFAGALREVGLPPGEVPLALAGFNTGVEIGQLLFVGGVLLAAAGWRRVVPRVPGWLRPASALGIGSLAAFWTIARVAAFR